MLEIIALCFFIVEGINITRIIYWVWIRTNTSIHMAITLQVKKMQTFWYCIFHASVLTWFVSVCRVLYIWWSPDINILSYWWYHVSIGIVNGEHPELSNQYPGYQGAAKSLGTSELMSLYSLFFYWTFYEIMYFVLF